MGHVIAINNEPPGAINAAMALTSNASDRAMAKRELTQSYLKSIVNYNPETGHFTWMARPAGYFEKDFTCKKWNAKYSGRQTGCRHSRTGNIFLRVNGKMYVGHRLAWLYMTGHWPSDEIDHRDLDRSNNRWDNLRAATRGENQRNTGLSKRNSSGFKGVSPYHGKWRASIQLNRKMILLGIFDSKEEAHKAYVSASLKYHGEFGRVA